MYSFVIYLYILGVKIAALFGNKKAQEMIRGHKLVLSTLKEKIKAEENYLWFHASSLGEFEQGRPLMERIRQLYPQYKILLTFFSPSGYTVRKDYKGADVVCYLPFDTPRNVNRFLNLSHPKMAFFIKYEFWQNYLKGLSIRHIPVYSVSSIFNEKQVFFRWYGGTYYKSLKKFSHLFVQNDLSKQLLKKIGITHVTVVGDTRFDRVVEIMHQAKELPLLESFCGQSQVFIAGSSWTPDEDIYVPYFQNHKEWKLVIAPHEVDEARIKEICTKLKRTCVRYSQATAENVHDADCLIIDCFGLLSSIYRYGTVAYIGGGFGKGIHNLPEAAVYSLPVIFGPNNKRFKEAQDLIACGGGFQISSSADFQTLFDRLISDKSYLAKAGKAAGGYVHELAGASEKIIQAIKF